jgi:hypothetical protein
MPKNMLKQLTKDLLRKMLHHRFIGEKHTSIDNLPKSFPKHLRGEVKEIAHELIKKGFLNVKPTSYGLEVSIKSDKLNEIKVLFSL